MFDYNSASESLAINLALSVSESDLKRRHIGVQAKYVLFALCILFSMRRYAPPTTITAHIHHLFMPFADFDCAMPLLGQYIDH